MKMNWRYKINGSHAHIRVYVNGALAGNLVLRVDELNELMQITPAYIIEFHETP